MSKDSQDHELPEILVLDEVGSAFNVEDDEQLDPPVEVEEPVVRPARLHGVSEEAIDQQAPGVAILSTDGRGLTFHISYTTSPSSWPSSPPFSVRFLLSSALPFPLPLLVACLAPDGRL